MQVFTALLAVVLCSVELCHIADRSDIEPGTVRCPGLEYDRPDWKTNKLLTGLSGVLQEAGGCWCWD